MQIGDDVLGKFLAAASKLQLKVLVGLQLVPMSSNVSETGALYADLVRDLHAGYGQEASFRGFYLTQEWQPGTVYDADDIGQNFIGVISDAAHALDPGLEVGLSPSLSDVLTWGPCQAAWYSDYGSYLGPCGTITTTNSETIQTPSRWAQWWTKALGHAPHFTWLFVQDHRGGQQSPQHVVAYYAALRPALDALNVTFWANAELFHIVADTVSNGGEGNATRTQGAVDRVHRQLMEEAPYVDGFTAWEWYWCGSPRVHSHKMVAATPRLPRGYSAETESRRRRGRDAETGSRRRRGRDAERLRRRESRRRRANSTRARRYDEGDVHAHARGRAATLLTPGRPAGSLRLAGDMTVKFRAEEKSFSVADRDGATLLWLDAADQVDMEQWCIALTEHASLAALDSSTLALKARAQSRTLSEERFEPAATFAVDDAVGIYVRSAPDVVDPRGNENGAFEARPSELFRRQFEGGRRSRRRGPEGA